MSKMKEISIEIRNIDWDLFNLNLKRKLTVMKKEELDKHIAFLKKEKKVLEGELKCG